MPQDAESPTYKAKDIRAVKKMQRRGKGLINSVVEEEYKEKIRWKLLLLGIIVEGTTTLVKTSWDTFGN